MDSNDSQQRIKFGRNSGVGGGVGLGTRIDEIGCCS